MVRCESCAARHRVVETVRQVVVLAVALLCTGCSSTEPTTTSSPNTSTMSSTSSSSRPSPATTSTSTPQPGPPYIGTLTWRPGRHGDDLIVTPTGAGRAVLGQEKEAAAWAEVARREPRADTVSMQRQFACHWRYARSKATWNLETWRTVVPMDQVVSAYCNPGGPE